jgi:PilX N-terminal
MGLRRTGVCDIGRSESGFALVVLLLVVLLVAVVGVAMMSGAVSEVQVASNESNTMKARYLAEAGIAAAANQLTQNNAWTGPVTQTFAGGSYTVQVDTAASQTGALGAVKSVISTGSVGSTIAGAVQTVRETFLVLPQAFSKPLVSDTVVTISDTNSVANTTVSNTVLRQLGTVHANNVGAASPAVTVQNGNGIVTVTGQITASQQSISIASGPLCTACAPATNQAVIPFPAFNFATYCNRASAAGTLFTSQTAFDNYVTNNTAGGVATLGSPNAPVDLFVEISTGFDLDESSPVQVYGTLIVYTQGNSSGSCTFSSSSSPAGDLVFNQSGAFSVQAENGEPALMVGGNIWNQKNNCKPRAAPPITINGLIYILSGTTNPAVTAVSGPGICVYGSDNGGGAVKFTGAMVTNVASDVNFDALTYDPSIFFEGLPSGLISPGPPYVLLPISWTSGK